MTMKDSYATKYPNTFVFFIFVLFAGLTMASTFTNMNTPIQDLYAIDMADRIVGGKRLNAGYLGGSAGDDSTSTTVSAAFSAAFFVGAFVGSLLTFPIVERLGRKLSTIIFCIATIALTALMCIPAHWAYLIVIRVLAGFPASCIQTVTPLWIAETCPPHRRGIATVGIQLFLTLGIFIAYIIDWALTSACRQSTTYDGSGKINGRDAVGSYGLPARSPAQPGLPPGMCTGPNLWYISFLATLVFLVGLIIFSFMIPEKIVTNKGVADAAASASNKSSVNINATSTELHATSVEIKPTSIDEGRKVDDTDSASFKDCFTRRDYRKCLAISFILPFLQQFTGINAVILFAGSFFSDVSLPDSSLSGAMIIGAWNFLSTIAAIPIVERMGRRFLLFLGTFILLAMLVLLIPVDIFINHKGKTTTSDAGSTAETKTPGGLLAGLMIGVLLYIFGFAIAPGPLVFTICGEMFPKAARVKFNGIAFAMHKLASIIVVFSFPYLQATLYGAFILYLVVTVFFTVLSWFLIPETKGKTLDEIEEIAVTDKVFEKFDIFGRQK